MGLNDNIELCLVNGLVSLVYCISTFCNQYGIVIVWHANSQYSETTWYSWIRALHSSQKKYIFSFFMFFNLLMGLFWAQQGSSLSSSYVMVVLFQNCLLAPNSFQYFAAMRVWGNSVWGYSNVYPMIEMNLAMGWSEMLVNHLSKAAFNYKAVPVMSFGNSFP